MKTALLIYLVKWALCLAVTLILLFVLTPSTKTAIYIIDGSGVVDVLQSDQEKEAGC